MPSWITDIQGITTVLDAAGDPVQRRKTIQVVGATVTDDGSKTVIEVPPGPTGATGADGAPAFPTEQLVTGVGPHDVTLDADADRLTFSDNGAVVLSSVSGGSATGRTVLIYYNGTGSLEIERANPGPSGNESQIEVDGAANLILTQGQSALLQAQGTLGWRLTLSPPRGRLLRAPQILTSGTSITHPAGTRLIRVRGVGGGGGGGGTGAAAGSCAAQGGSATYGERTYTASSLSSTYTIGAGGTGGVDGTGGTGGDSTFTHGGVTITCPGGRGGARVAGGSTVSGQNGGAPATPATNADFSITGQEGSDVIRPSASTSPTMHVGPAGSNPLGQGAAAQISVGGDTPGRAGTGYGSGGGGSLNSTGTVAQPGAAGQPGCWIVEEYS